MTGDVARPVADADRCSLDGLTHPLRRIRGPRSSWWSLIASSDSFRFRLSEGVAL